MTPPAASIDTYIAGFTADVQTILKKIRALVRKTAPGGDEVISYGIPAMKRNGRVLVYFAAFKNHIGLFPPVRGDATLMKAIKPYAGPKGNLKFPLDEPMPYDLIRRVVKFHVRKNVKASAATAKTTPKTKTRKR